MTPNENQILTLLEKATPCSIIPGTVLLEAEVYHKILTLLRCPTCKGSKEWTEGEPGHEETHPCPTCGGSKRVPNPTYGLLEKTKTDIIREITCPDCQAEPAEKPLTINQIAILDHTLHRAAGGYYCGNSGDMKILVKLGLMCLSGTKSGCMDEYFTITERGRKRFSRSGG